MLHVYIIRIRMLLCMCFCSCIYVLINMYAFVILIVQFPLKLRVGIQNTFLTCGSELTDFSCLLATLHRASQGSG